MLRYIYSNLLSSKLKIKIKFKYYDAVKFISDIFFHYNTEELRGALLSLGVQEGDSLFIHSSYNTFSGFQGTPQDIITCFVQSVGEKGNILMMSIPYMTSSYEYLKQDPVFDVRKTQSRMGVISEIFRRKKGVLRSFHPTHPVLALGADAPWLVEGHEKCIYPCGKGSPFDKFQSLKGKILFFDTPFNTFTFIHYIEDLIKDRLPFPLYSEEPIPARMKDYEGNEVTTNAYVFSDATVKRRDPDILEDHLLKGRMLKKAKIGKTTLMLVTAEDAIRCTYEMMGKNIYFYKGLNVHG